MVTSCYALNCTSRFGAVSRGEKITFHRFPQKLELRRLWAAAVKRYDPVTKKQWEPKKHACLCSEHFVPEDFRYNRGYRLLREGAIPTRFNYVTTKSNKTIEPRNKDVSGDVALEPTPSCVLPSNLDDTVPNKSEEVPKTSNSKTIKSRFEEVPKTNNSKTIKSRFEEVSKTNNSRSEAVSKTNNSKTNDSKTDNSNMNNSRSEEVPKTNNSKTSNTYSEWLLENLFSRCTQDIFCDTVLIIGKRQLKAHSVVLSAGSTFFHSALKLYSKPGLRYLTLPGIDYDVLQIAVRFIYTGKFEVGTKYVKSDQRAELLNSLRKLGLNLKHLEECEIIHNSDEEEVVTGSLRKRSTDGTKVQDRAESSSANKQSSRAVGAKVQDRAESSSANKLLFRVDGAKVEDRAESSLANKQSFRVESARVEDRAESSSANKQSSRADGVKVEDRAESSSAKKQPSIFVFCDRLSKSVVPVKSKNSQDQSSLVSSSLLVEEIEGVKVEDVGCDVASTPAGLLIPIDCRTPVDCNSVLSEVNNGWVLRSKTGVHFVEVPQELLAEVGRESRKNLPNQAGGKVQLDSVKKSSHSRAMKVRVNEGDVSPIHPRRILPRPGPSCSTSAVDPVHEELPIVKQKRVHQKQQYHACPFCGKQFFGKSHYDVHLRRHTGEKPYSCKLCGKTFGISANLRRHLRTHADDRRYLCDFCGYAFTEKSTLDDHVASMHTEEKKHMCMFCGKLFPTLGCYRAHSKRHARGTGSVTYLREYTKLSEPMRRLYEEAVLTASTEGSSRFACKICNKDYASKTILTLHLKRHSIAKPFVCSLCKKSFWQRSHLEVHERSHTGETPFTCGTCGKGFSSRGKLGIHEMLHTDKKPYKCATCDSSFSLPAYLKLHMRMHNDDRPYECTLCGKKYRKKINLQLHLNRAHICNEDS